MATPITWRNVRGGSDATSARLMQNAGQSFDGMFNELDNVLQTKNNQLERRDTDAFKQLLTQQYGGDAQALAEAQQSGEVAGLRERFQYANREKTGTDAITGMVGDMQERELQDQQYLDNKQQVGNREARNNFYGELANGNVEGASAIYKNNDWVDPTALTSSLQTTKQQQANNTHRDRVYQLSANADAREAREQGWTAEDRRRRKEERETTRQRKELLNTTYSDLAAPLAEDETYTQRKDRINEIFRSDKFKWMAPSEREQYKQQTMRAVTTGEAVAQGDLDAAQEVIAPVEAKMGRNSFSEVNNRTEDNGTIASQLIQDFSDENGQLFEEGDANSRLELGTAVQMSLAGKTPDGQVLVEGGIPQSWVRRAMEGVQGVGALNWDKAFGDQLEKIVTSEGFRNEMEEYGSLDSELRALKNQVGAAARNGDLGAMSSGGQQSPQQQEQQQGGGNSGGATGVEALINGLRSMGAQGSNNPEPTNPGPTQTPGNAPRGGSDVSPVLPTGDTPQVSQSERPPIPEVQEREGGPISMDTPLGELVPNMLRSFGNAKAGWDRETLVKNVDEVGSLIKNGSVGGVDKARLTQIVKRNPETIQYMSADERNVLRNILGERMVNALME